MANFARNYGDLLGVLTTLEKGGELVHIPTRNEEISAEIDEQIERVPTQHDEMQWRLIRLGRLARCDVWIPRNDQPKMYRETSSVILYYLNSINLLMYQKASRMLTWSGSLDPIQ